MERKANFSSKMWRLWCSCPKALQYSHPKAAEISMPQIELIAVER